MIFCGHCQWSHDERSFCHVLLLPDSNFILPSKACALAANSPHTLPVIKLLRRPISSWRPEIMRCKHVTNQPEKGKIYDTIASRHYWHRKKKRATGRDGLCNGLCS